MAESAGREYVQGMSLLDRITIEAAKMILADFPDLEADHMRAAIAYAQARR